MPGPSCRRASLGPEITWHVCLELKLECSRTRQPHRRSRLPSRGMLSRWPRAAWLQLCQAFAECGRPHPERSTHPVRARRDGTRGRLASSALGCVMRRCSSPDPASRALRCPVARLSWSPSCIVIIILTRFGPKSGAGLGLGWSLRMRSFGVLALWDLVLCVWTPLATSLGALLRRVAK